VPVESKRAPYLRLRVAREQLVYLASKRLWDSATVDADSSEVLGPFGEPTAYLRDGIGG
jgi:hypothetical protein